jgi:hydroxypyruvate isomerase
LKQAATRGCFGRGKTMEEVAAIALRLGLKGIDLVGPADWPVLKKYGLQSTMCPGGGKLSENINHKENHAVLEPQYRESIERAAAFGAPNVIALSGNKRGIADEEGLDNTVAFLNKVKAHAEDKGITICLELLNSKVDHKDYQCDRTWWGVEVMKRVNSPRVKLLYDVYHMQIMEGDVIATIREFAAYIGHYHTGGVPGRNEIDETQELNYRRICQVILETGFKGYLAHEFVPKRDPLESLKQAVSLCDV